MFQVVIEVSATDSSYAGTTPSNSLIAFSCLAKDSLPLWYKMLSFLMSDSIMSVAISGRSNVSLILTV